MVSTTSAMTTILVVEDDPSVAELVRAVLNDVPGWGAVVAYDARAAISLLEHVPADVLVVDVNLPGVSGIEMLAQLRRDARWHNPPVILMSANVPEQVADEVLGRDGYVQFLAKPFDIDDLIDAVNAASTLRPHRAVRGQSALRQSEPPDHQTRPSARAS